MSRRRIVTLDRVALASRRWLTPGEPKAAVVLVHGFTASSDCPNVERVAESLHALGLDVITYDARGHGKSEGESTLGDLEHHDVAAAVDLARRRTDRVILVGASMGAIAVIRHASRQDGAYGVVAVSCPARWRLPRNPTAVVAAVMTRTPVGRAALRRFAGVRVASRWTDPIPPIELVELVGVPITFVHGEADRFIPHTDAAELHSRAGSTSRLHIVEGMGHAYDEFAVAYIVDAVDTLLEAPAA